MKETHRPPKGSEKDRFPKPTALSATIKVWRAQEISNWIDGQYADQGGTRHE